MKLPLAFSRKKLYDKQMIDEADRDLFGLIKPKKVREKADEFFAKISDAQNLQRKKIINLQNITKIYGETETETRALNGVNLEIFKGEFVIIMGASGSGKTTLLNIIGLLDRPTSGKYELDGQNFAKFSTNKKARIRGKNIGFIFQDFNLIESLNVLDNVALPLQYSSRKMTYQNEQTASEILAKFGMNSKEYYASNQLSGGQKQRVAIARALVNSPSIILADEPTGSLDSENSELIMKEFSRIHAAGNTILLVTHNPDLLKFGSRAIYMGDGKIKKNVELTDNEAFRISRKFTSVREKNAKKLKRISRKTTMINGGEK